MIVNRSRHKELTKAVNNISYVGKDRDLTLTTIFNEQYLSDFLAWALDRQASHGWHSRFLTGMMKLIAQRRSKDGLDYERSATTLKSGKSGIGVPMSNLNLGNATVVRELHFAKSKTARTNFLDIAILDFDKTDDFLVTIENKLFGHNTNNQLQKYYEQIDRQYKNAKCKEFVYLTFDGSLPKRITAETQARWVTLSWIDDLLPLLQDLQNKKSPAAVFEVTQALEWAKSLMGQSTSDLMKEVRSTYLAVIGDIFLYDLNRHLDTTKSSWSIDKVNDASITFKMPSASVSGLSIELMSNLDIAFGGKSSEEELFGRYILPFGLPVSQMINMIEYFIRLIYKENALKSWAKHYVNRHRNKSTYLKDHRANASLLKVINTNKQELRIIEGINKFKNR